MSRRCCPLNSLWLRERRQQCALYEPHLIVVRTVGGTGRRGGGRVVSLQRSEVKDKFEVASVLCPSNRNECKFNSTLGVTKPSPNLASPIIIRLPGWVLRFSIVKVYSVVQTVPIALVDCFLLYQSTFGVL